MKKIKSLKKNLIFLFTLYSLSLNSQFSSAMSYNIRYANSSDGINKWENRKDASTDSGLGASAQTLVLRRMISKNFFSTYFWSKR